MGPEDGGEGLLKVETSLGDAATLVFGKALGEEGEHGCDARNTGLQKNAGF